MVHDPRNPVELYVPVDVQRPDPQALGGLSLPHFFPAPVETTRDGLLCLGGSLEPRWLLDAYRHGIFPWPVWDDEPMAWWCPDPRAILEFHEFHVPRRLRRTIRSGRFHATCDQDFAGVMHGCATAAGRYDNTWLTPRMKDAYLAMFRQGHAHSVEVWKDGQLAGGTYGIAVGGLFAAESMFYYLRDASKVALAYLVAHLRVRGYSLLDVQQWTAHTSRLGVSEISRRTYLRRLAEAVARPVQFGNQLAGDVAAL